jgi:hypothetical protein
MEANGQLEALGMSPHCPLNVIRWVSEETGMHWNTEESLDPTWNLIPVCLAVRPIPHHGYWLSYPVGPKGFWERIFSETGSGSIHRWVGDTSVGPLKRTERQSLDLVSNRVGVSSWFCFWEVHPLAFNYYNFYKRAVNRNWTNSVAWDRERTIPTERPPLVGEVTSNFCG